MLLPETRSSRGSSPRRLPVEQMLLFLRLMGEMMYGPMNPTNSYARFYVHVARARGSFDSCALKERTQSTTHPPPRRDPIIPPAFFSYSRATPLGEAKKWRVVFALE